SLARALVIGLRTEIRHVDDERVAFPVTARVAVPLPDACRQMRASIHDDVALPALALTDIVENGNAAGRLHDAAEAAAVSRAEFRQAACEAAVRKRTIFGIVVAVHARGVVARRRLGAERRRLGIAFAPGASDGFVLA